MDQARELGPFTLQEPIGEGGFGRVWRATHRRSGATVAIKLLTGQPADPSRLKRAVGAEVRAMAQLDHPHILRILDHGEDAAGTPWIAMEYAPGGTLQEVVGRLSWRALRAALVQLLEALAHAHSLGVLHRDLKPSNVLLALGPSDVRLGDFGLARLRRLGEGEPGLAVRGGSLPYMAPEQFGDDEEAEGPWTDLYGLGCLAWAMVTGQPPYATSSWVHARRSHALDELPPLPKLRAVPIGFLAWLQALLQKDPMARPPFAADALAALNDLDDPPEDPTPGPGPPRAGEESATFVLEGPLGPAPGPPPRVEGPAPLPPAPFPPMPEAQLGSQAPGSLVDVGLSLSPHRPWPVVGWRGEKRALWGALAEVVHGSVARAVVLSGDDDSGAAWLARWLATSAARTGQAEVIHARCEGTRGAEALRHATTAWAQVRRAAPGTRRARLGRRCGDAEPWVAEALSEWTADPSRPWSGALAAALAAASARRPLVLWLDAPDADPEIFGFITSFLRRQAAVPARVLLLLTGIQAPWEEPGVTHLDVPKLPREHLEEMLRLRLPLHPTLLSRVATLAVGSPVIAAALVDQWFQSQALEPTPAGYVLVGGDEVLLPEDRAVDDPWQARLRPLHDEPRALRAVEIGAALGIEVDASEWRPLIEGDGQDVVDRLADLGIADPTPTGWAFTSARAHRAVVAAARSRGTWRAAHTAIADLPALATQPVRRAEHLLEAGRPEEALSALVPEIRMLLQRGESRKAWSCADLAQRAAAALGAPDRHPKMIALRALVASASLARIGPSDRPALEALLADARAHAPDQVGSVLSSLAETEPTTPRRRARLLEAVEAAKLHGDLERTALDLVRVVWTHFDGADLAAAEEVLHEASRWVERTGQERLRAVLHLVWSDLWSYRNDPERTSAHADLAERHARAVGDPMLVARALRRRFRPAVTPIADVRAACEEALAIYQRWGNDAGVAATHTQLGQALLPRQPAEAARSFRQALAWRRIAGGNTCLERIHLAVSMLAQDLWDEASVCLDEALAEAEAGAIEQWVYMARMLALGPAARRGDWDRVEALRAQLPGPAEAPPIRDHCLHQVAAIAAEAALAAGRLELARWMLSQAVIQMGDDLAAPAEVARVRGMLASLPPEP